MNIDSFLVKISTVILNPIIQVLFAVATVIFLWGVVLFIKDSDSPEKRKEGGQKIMYGLIGMFVMFTAFALVKIVVGTFNIPVPDIINK